MKILLALLILTGSSAAGGHLKNMFKEYCVSCHGPDKQKGKVRLDNVDLMSSPKLVEDLIYVLEEGDMPPRKKTQPSEKLLASAMEELHQLSSSFSDTAVKRLTREEYTNTINDIFGTQFNLQDLLPEDKSDHGFNKIPTQQIMSPHQIQSYLKTARFIANRLIPDRTPEKKVYIFTAENFRGSGKGDYHNKDEFILSTHYPWRSNVHFSTEKINTDKKIVHKKEILCIAADQTYERFQIPDYGTYRYEVKYRILNTDKPQTAGFNLGDPRYPTNFKRIKRFYLPYDADTLTFEISLRKGSYTSFTFDSASKWNVGKKPENYKGPKLAFKEVKITGPIVNNTVKVILPTKTMNIKTLTDHLLKLLIKRNLSDATKEDFYLLAESNKNSGASQKEIARTLITAILCSPHFLYKAEKTNYALVAKLAYFLWNSAPDSKLIHELRDASTASLKKQIDRMTADPKIERFYKDFSAQWLQTEKIDDISPDMREFREVSPLHVAAMKQEPYEFLKQIFENDLSMENFIDSDFIMVNEKLADFYGIKGIKGNEFRAVQLPTDNPRGGLIGQAGFLKQTSGTFKTSPILRGVWIIKNLYGEKMEPPTDVIIKEPDIRGTTTVREIMEKHQSSDNCYRCHAKIDPLGLALEHYDPVGKYRKEYTIITVINKNKLDRKKVPIDSKAVLPNGEKADSLKSLKNALMEDKEKIVKGIISKLISYSSGRKTSSADRHYINDVYKSIKDRNFSLKEAVSAIILHENFRH